MIYYFSGTGNSEFVAMKLAEYTKDEYAFIPDVFANMTGDIQVAEGDVIGVVCPIYAWGVPECVADFLTHVRVDPKAFAYIVATCGSSAGKALKTVEKIFPYNSAYSVRMPENCIPLFKTDSEELTREKINVARQLLPRIAQSIISRAETYDVKEGFEGSFKTAVINPLFTSFFMRTSRFKVSDECTGCGECAASCPFGIIAINDSRPAWQSDRCQMCMRCVMSCPTRALRIGLSAKHEVYLFPADLMTQGGVKGSVVVPECGEAVYRGVHETHQPTIDAPAAGSIPIMAGDSSVTAQDIAKTESEHIPDEVPSMTGSTPDTKAAILADIAQLERTVADLRRRVERM